MRCTLHHVVEEEQQQIHYHYQWSRLWRHFLLLSFFWRLRASTLAKRRNLCTYRCKKNKSFFLLLFFFFFFLFFFSFDLLKWRNYPGASPFSLSYESDKKYIHKYKRKVKNFVYVFLTFCIDSMCKLAWRTLVKSISMDKYKVKCKWKKAFQTCYWE